MQHTSVKYQQNTGAAVCHTCSGHHLLPSRYYTHLLPQSAVLVQVVLGPLIWLSDSRYWDHTSVGQA